LESVWREIQRLILRKRVGGGLQLVEDECGALDNLRAGPLGPKPACHVQRHHARVMKAMTPVGSAEQEDVKLKHTAFRHAHAMELYEAVFEISFEVVRAARSRGGIRWRPPYCAVVFSQQQLEVACCFAYLCSMLDGACCLLHVACCPLHLRCRRLHRRGHYDDAQPLALACQKTERRLLSSWRRSDELEVRIEQAVYADGEMGRAIYRLRRTKKRAPPLA
jgi:hypothetical protein